jgi:hypothetical protein
VENGILNGNQWSDPPASIGPKFEDASVTDIASLAVLDGTIFAGAGKDNPLGIKGIAVWCSQDGITWEPLKEQQIGPLHIHAMAPFSGNLYVGGYHELDIYRTDGKTTWETVTDGVQVLSGLTNKSAGVWCMAPTDDKLYIGACGVENNKILWVTSDGKTWSSVDTNMVGNKGRCSAIIVFKDYLYITTKSLYWWTHEGRNAGMKEESKLEVWRYGDCWASALNLLESQKPFLGVLPILKKGVGAIAHIIKRGLLSGNYG